MTEWIKIANVDDVWQISNLSDFNLMMTGIPIKPKRKNTDIIMIRAKSFVVYDGIELDITQFTFQFIKDEKK